jgi:hypothetical protein
LKLVFDLSNFIVIGVFEIESDKTFKVGLEGFLRGVSFKKVITFESMGVDPFEFLLPRKARDKLVDLLLAVKLSCLMLELRDLPE